MKNASPSSIESRERDNVPCPLRYDIAAFKLSLTVDFVSSKVYFELKMRVRGQCEVDIDHGEYHVL